MMFTLDQLTRTGPNRVSCKVLYNGVKYDFTAKHSEDHLGLKGITFSGLSVKDELLLLTNSDEGRAFTAVLFKFFEGEELRLPMKIESDYPWSTSQNP